MSKPAVVGAGLMLAALLTGGCASALNESQLDRLESVTLVPPTAAKDAYHKPDATKSPGMANLVPLAAAGGFIPALVGGAIDKGVMITQQKDFEQSAAKYFEQIKPAASTLPLTPIERQFRNRLKADPFFGPRYDEHSRNTFYVEVTKLGLIRATEATKDDMKLCYEISATVTLYLESGGKLIEELITGTSTSSARIAQIYEKPALLSKFRVEAIISLSEKFQGVLDLRLGRTSQSLFQSK